MRIKIGYNAAWPVAIIFGVAFLCFIIGQGNRNAWSYAGGIITLIAGVPLVIAGLWNGGKALARRWGWIAKEGTPPPPNA